MTISSWALVLSCEHAGNRVPARYRHLFRKQTSILGTHRAYDLGIYPMARQLARQLDCPLFACFITRLLIDTNRSTRHRDLLSEFSRDLPRLERQRLTRAYYQPYRESVIDAIERHVAAGRCVLHVSLHSFTPKMKERVRNTDIGVLYDTRRPPEMHLAKHLQESIVARTGLRVRRNYPYRGAADGFVASLRMQFAESSYVGLEMELNQGLFRKKPQASAPCRIGKLAGILSESLVGLVHDGNLLVCHSSESD